jgi:RsmE family RNA methyltransferase
MGRTLRFFCPEINRNTVITDAQFHHLTKVLRLQSGAAIELFDGKGTLARALISKIEKHQACVAVLDTQIFPQPDKRRIIIAPSIAKVNALIYSSPNARNWALTLLYRLYTKER